MEVEKLVRKLFDRQAVLVAWAIEIAKEVDRGELR